MVQFLHYYGIMNEGPGRGHVNYKRAVAEHVRSEAKTKDQGLIGDDKRINSNMSRDVTECGLC